MPETARSPLARLVLFMICLSVAGSLAAGIHYVTIDLPEQLALPAPTNGCDETCFFGCMQQQKQAFYGCLCDCLVRQCQLTSCQNWKYIPDTWRR